MPIQQLPQSLINKIAAGEVIERPASVVKELMENAVDAGATRVDVSIEKGGADVIRVVDNGRGIEAEQLPLAVAAHATSKLTEADDLFRVGTLGFRGEALASIAEISRLTMRSRRADCQSGAQIEVVGGKASDVTPCGCPVGTSVEVRNLFFNTPVRRKFLKKTQTEFGHISEAVTRIALPLPGVHFTLRHNDRQVFELAASDDWLGRITRLLGRELAENMIAIESTDPTDDGQSIRLSGYVANPSKSRGNNRMQYLFLNGRHIRDRALQHALTEAYRGLLTVGRYPIAVLRLEMPPELVDVNVHPTKLEVRFQDSGRLYSQLLSTLRGKFLATDLTAQVQTPDDDPTGGHDEVRATELRQELVDWAKGEVATWDRQESSDSGSPRTSSPGASSSGGRQPLELNRLDRPWRPAIGPSEAGPGESSPSSDAEPSTHRTTGAMQVHNRYLVTESEDGITVIDQHALHERVLYEQLRRRIESGTIETQNLLVPEPIDLSPAEAAAVLENVELLARLGVKIEPFGGDTVLVAGYPAMLANIAPAEILHELVERLIAGGKEPDRRDVLDELLHTIACKAAIKAGDRLAPEEIDALLGQWYQVDDPHHCPHGRPAALTFSREELDRQFRRT